MNSEPSRDRVTILVGEAVEIVARQLDCGVIEAFDRLRDRSVARGESLEYTALDVIDGVITFDPLD
jgi:hypothetical protein